MASNPPSNITIDIFAAPNGQALVDQGSALTGDITSDGATFQANLQNLVANATYDFSLEDHANGNVIASDSFTVGQQDDQAASANGANDCVSGDGTCGSADGQSFTSAPNSSSDELCSAGTATTPVASGLGWTWICQGTGSNNTNNDTCYTAGANGSGGSSTTALCGSATTSTTNIGLSDTDLCVPSASLVENPTQNADDSWSWSCTNEGTGQTSTCSTMPVNSQECGSADGTVTSTMPSSNLCQSWASLVGNVTQATSGAESGTWGWTCADQQTGLTSSCGTSPLGSPTNTNTCGSADGSVNTQSTPPAQASLCPSGSTASTPDQAADNTWGWTCTDSAGDPPLECGTAASATTTGTTTGLQNPFKTLNSFPDILAAIMNNIVLPIAVPFIAVAIMYSGFLFIVAREKGSIVKLAEAKKTFLYTMIGAAIVLGAFVISNAITGTVSALTSMLFHISDIV